MGKQGSHYSGHGFEERLSLQLDMAVPPVCVLIRIPSLKRLKTAGLTEGFIFYVQANVPDPVPILLSHLRSQGTFSLPC